jgi:hypothetical protein
VSLLQSFDFIKARVEKKFSSFTLPIMCTMANSTNLTYSGKRETNIRDVVTRCHILVNGLMSKGGTIQVVAFDLMVSLNMPCWQSRSVIQEFLHLNLLFVHIAHYFVIVESCFKNLKEISKRCITIRLQPILGIHNPKNIHDTMG